MTGWAVLIGFVLLAAVVYRLGNRWLDLMAAEMDVRPRPRRRRRKKKRPAARRSAEESDLDEDDDEEEEAEDFAGAVRDVDQFDQLAKQAWIDERRADGWDEEEIERVLEGREPVAQLNG